MKRSKIVAFVLAVFMILSTAVLTGCGKKDEVVYDPNNFIADTTNPQIVKEPVTIKFYVPKHSLHTDYNEMRVFKEVERITNINMEFVQVDWEAYSEKRALQWEDQKTLPDAFMFANNLDEQVLYSSLGMLAPLNDLIDEFCPNYKALMNEYKEIEQASKLTDGNIYSFACVNNKGSTCYQYVNNKWLTDLYNDGVIDFTMPSTTEEFREMLVAFKNNDPNHNGIADEIPLCSKFNYTSIFLLSAFGHVTKSIEMTDNGQFIFVPQTEAYKEYIRYAKDLYDAGLMNQNIYEITDGDVANYGTQNMVGCSENVAAFLLVGDELAGDYVTVPPLTSNYSPVVNGEKQKVHICFSMFDPTALIITEKTLYKREIARLIDFFYSEQGVQLFLTGKEGTDWVWDDETKTSWHNTYPSNIDTETYRGSITPNVGLGAGFFLDKNWTDKQTNELNETLRKDMSVYVPYMRTDVPSLVFTTTESDDLTYIKLALDSYVQAMEADFITGRKSLDKDWDAFQSTLTKMQVETLKQIYATAYARSLA